MMLNNSYFGFDDGFLAGFKNSSKCIPKYHQTKLRFNNERKRTEKP